MSKNCSENPNFNWWREAKALSLERKKNVLASGLAKPGDAFLIVTEGTVTEPIYFDLLLRDLQLSVVRIKVIPGQHSDPRHVIRTAEKEAKDQKKKSKKGTLANDEPAFFEHVWAVVDTDVAILQGFWKNVEHLAKACKVNLAHSTPCIEFWLLLHISDYTTRSDLVDGTAAKKAVRDALGEDYSTNEKVAKLVFPKFIAGWTKAVIHAEQVRRYHQDANTQTPANPSTEVCQLVRALNDAALPHLRKLKKV